MPINALEHDWAVGDDGVEVSGCREALFRPQLLVPAEPDDPFRVRVRRRVVAQALLQVRKRARAREIQPQCGEAQIHHVPVGID